MKNILTLYKILTRNTEMRLPKTGGKGTLYLSLGIIAASCIMLPCCFIVGFVSYIMGLALTEAGAPTNGLLAEIHIMSAFSMVFGILVIFSILFFSSDREHLVPLPFKSHEIMLGKFLYSYMAESVMEFLILIAMFIGFFIAWKPGIISIISSIVGVILIPLLPLAYCALFSLILFGLFKGFHNTRFINHLSTIVMLIFIGIFLLSFRGMGAISVDNYVVTLADNSNLFSIVLNKLFFTVPILLKAIENNSIVYLLFYIITNAVVILILAFVGSLLYQPCLYAVGAMGDSKKSTDNSLKKIKENSIFKAYLVKEFKVLLRTKAYSNNCVFINLLWPAGLTLFLHLNRNKDIITKMISSYQTGNANSYVILGIACILLAFIASAMNSVASTSFTREGAHLSLVKYIPVPYTTQILVKGATSLIITFPPLLLCVIITAIYFHMNPLWCIYYGLLILICIIITTVIGLLLDSASPHSSWDDEYSALRGNLNTFFDMAIMMVLSALISTITFILYSLKIINLLGFHVILMAVPLVISIICIFNGKNQIIKNMEEM